MIMIITMKTDTMLETISTIMILVLMLSELYSKSRIPLKLDLQDDFH